MTFAETHLHSERLDPHTGTSVLHSRVQRKLFWDRLKLPGERLTREERKLRSRRYLPKAKGATRIWGSRLFYYLILEYQIAQGKWDTPAEPSYPL